MVPVRPAVRGVLSSRAISVGRPANVQPCLTACHNLHSSARRPARQRPRQRGQSTEQQQQQGGGQAMSPDAVKAFAKTRFPDYKPEELAALRQKYSDSQVAAVQAGEQAIDPEDLTRQGRLRTDPYRLRYMEDFATLRPVVDKKPRGANDATRAPRQRWLTREEFVDDVFEWSKTQVPGLSEQLSEEEAKRLIDDHNFDGVELLKYWHERPAVTADVTNKDKLKNYKAVAGPRDEVTARAAMARGLPRKVPGVEGLYEQPTEDDEGDAGQDDEGEYTELKRLTGLKVKELKKIQTKVLVVRMVANQTRLGKIPKASVLAIAGNGNGWLGLGEAKSTESPVAIEKARLAAIKNMRPLRRYENRTIYGNVEVKISGSIVQLFSRPPGFGLRVSHRIFEMCRAAGIQDLAAKLPRSRNPMNTVKATYQALMQQPDPEEIALGRGKKLVDARKVYYGGNVY